MKYLRTISAVTAVTAVGLGVGGTATAAVRPAASTCTTEPVWEASTTVFGTPAQNHEYTVSIQGGTFEAEWSSSWNLAVNYLKKPDTGSTTVTFEVFDIYTSVNGSGVETETCGYGPGSQSFPVSSGGSAPYMFSGANQPPKPYNDITLSGGTETEVIAVMHSGNYYYGIGFPG